MTPGMKTSEFLVALVPLICGLVLTVLGVFKGQSALIDTGMTLLVGSSGAYGLSRGLAKFGTGTTDPAPTPAPAPADEKAAANVVAGQ